jgi:hypothetical protein
LVSCSWLEAKAGPAILPYHKSVGRFR